jgi:IS1 family transposase
MRYTLPPVNVISPIVETEAAAIKFLQHKGVLPLEITCQRCGETTTLNYLRKTFRCKRTQCRYEQSCMSGTFFAGHRTPANKIIEAAYYWLAKSTNAQVQTYTALANATVTSLVNYFREVVSDSLDEIDLVIGGDGITVEIDETKLGKRKYNRGHRVEGVWVLVGVERTAERKVFLRTLPDRTKQTLSDMIQRHVLHGSTIITDCWRGYNGLEELGYTHLTVNHSKTFVDEETGACTNTVEGTNNSIKMSIRPRNRTTSCDDNLWEFVWRRKHENNLWDGFIQALVDIRYE